MNRSFVLEFQTDASGAVTGLKSIDGAVVNLDTSLDKVIGTASRFGSAMSTVYSTYSTTLSGEVAQSLAGYQRQAGAAEGATRRLSESQRVAQQLLMQLTYVANDAQAGIRGISNNADGLFFAFRRLRASAGGVTGALRTLASSFLSSGGLLLAVNLAATAWVVYKDRQREARKETEDQTDAVKDQWKELTRLRDVLLEIDTLQGGSLFGKVSELEGDLRGVRQEIERTQERIQSLLGQPGQAVRVFRVDEDTGKVISEVVDKQTEVARLLTEVVTLRAQEQALLDGVNELERAGVQNITFRVSELKKERDALADLSRVLTDSEQSRLNFLNLEIERLDKIRESRIADGKERTKQEEVALSLLQQAQVEVDELRAKLAALAGTDRDRLIALRRQANEMERQLALQRAMIEAAAGDPLEPIGGPTAPLKPGVDELDMSGTQVELRKTRDDADALGEAFDNLGEITGNFANAASAAFGRNAAAFKAIALAETIIATARAVAQALPNVPLAISVGALGAAQVARILSTSIPGGGGGGGPAARGVSPRAAGVITVSPSAPVAPNAPPFLIPADVTSALTGGAARYRSGGSGLDVRSYASVEKMRAHVDWFEVDFQLRQVQRVQEAAFGPR